MFWGKSSNDFSRTDFCIFRSLLPSARLPDRPVGCPNSCTPRPLHHLGPFDPRSIRKARDAKGMNIDERLLIGGEFACQSTCARSKREAVTAEPRCDRQPAD